MCQWGWGVLLCPYGQPHTSWDQAHDVGEGEGARHSVVLSHVLSTSHLRCSRLINFN